MFNSGTANLTLTDCTLSGNSASVGGGVSNSGTANLTDCTVSGNCVIGVGSVYGYFGGVGGGVYDASSATATLTDTIVAGNSSDIGGTYATSRAATT